MKSIAVDVGNSFIKAGLVTENCGAWANVFRWSHLPDDQLAIDEPLAWWIASVNRSKFLQLTDWISIHRPDDQIQPLDWTNVPLQIQLGSPDLIGMDRLCAAVAGRALAENRACIVVDAGTAITVDAVSRAGEFLGGTIFLGMRGALDQLALSTDALPRLEIPSSPDGIEAIGRSTSQALRSGVVLAAAGGIREIVMRLQTELDQPAHVVLTGGDARLLHSFLNFEHALVDHLVLDGVSQVGQRLTLAYDRNND